MRKVKIQVEIVEDDGSLILIFYGRYGGKRREIVPFTTQAARMVNKNLHYTLLALLQEYQPSGTIEGSILHEEE